MEISALPEITTETTGYVIADNGTTYKVSTDVIKGEVENNLSTTTPGAQLDARQGRLLGMSETENESKLIAINTVLDAEIAETRSMQVMRLPGEDTESVIPANASDMLIMVGYDDSNAFDGEYVNVYPRLYNPQLGQRVLCVGGNYDGMYGVRLIVNATPGGLNSLNIAHNGHTDQTLNTTALNYFRIYKEE
jgi:hypothetical protein